MTERRQLKAQYYQPPGDAEHLAVSVDVAHDSSFVRVDWWRSQIFLMVVAFALLMLGGGLLILFVPPTSTLDETNKLAGLVETKQTNGKALGQLQAANSSLSPWDAEQRAQAREQAQAILSDLVSLKRTMQELAVQDWGVTDFMLAQQLAEQGDDLYAVQEYPRALAKYRQALTKMQEVEAQIPSVINAYVSEANAESARGRFELAEQIFQKALHLNPNHIPALAGLARLEVLPDVLSRIDMADSGVAQYRESNDPALLEQAVQDYQTALELDTMAPLAEEKIQTAKNLLIEHRFNAAMTKAMQAMLASNYSTAQQQFSAALKERPEHGLAQQALAQALALNKGSSISSLFAEAKQLENQEAWQQAQSLYEAILQRDASQVRARSALVQAKVRAQFDTSLRDILADPMRVTDPERRAKVEAVLTQAKGIRRQGPVLDTQIQQIDELLAAVSKNVSLSISSDLATTVYLLKRGAKPIEYAPFSTKQLMLPPGRYALSGQRIGYQDVRKELVIEPNSPEKITVDIRSLVPISVNQGGML